MGNRDIIGPVFFDNNVNGDAYVRMIDEEVVPALDGIARYRRRNGRFQRLWWAQDGAPCHRTRAVTDRLTDRLTKQRQGKLTPAAKQFITKFVKDKWCRGYRKAARALNSSGILGVGVTVHPSCVQRYIRSQPWGKTSYKMEVKPLRNYNHKEKRLAACNNWHRNGYLDDSEQSKQKRMNIMWTDE